MTWRSPNPYDSEGYYNLGLSLLWQGREQEAYDAFYKATWSSAQQETSYYYLAVIAARRHLWAQALGFVEKGLVKNAIMSKREGSKRRCCATWESWRRPKRLWQIICG